VEALSARRVAEALELYDDAERQRFNPDECAAGRWVCHMLCGDFSRAWQESEAITRRGKPDPHRFWDGTPVDDRKVLIRCLHGLGDTIQFVRYAPLVRARARSLTIEAQPVLKELLRHSRLADQVITWGDPEPPWDQQIEIIELPRIFKTTLASIPNSVPYLDVPGITGVSIQDAICVGIVWASSEYNPARSIPLQEMARIFSYDGVQFFSLQAGVRQRDLAPWKRRVKNLCDESACIMKAAQNLKKLDLVITVDTMMPHLAGALGRPVWTLLHFESDWRWMLDRLDSPWYPTMRLFRQPRPGDWRTVIDCVCVELETLIRRRACGSGRLAGQCEIEGGT
jgi:hypothetical protein